MEKINPNGLNPKIMSLKKAIKVGDKIKIKNSMATVLEKYENHFLIANKYGFKESFTYARIALIESNK